MAGSGGGKDEGEATRYAAEWRENAMRQFAAQTDINRQTTQHLADLAGAVTDLKDDVKSIRDAMQRAPEGVRGNINIAAIIVGIGVTALCGGSGFLLSFAQFISNHWR